MQCNTYWKEHLNTYEAYQVDWINVDLWIIDKHNQKEPKICIQVFFDNMSEMTI